MLSASRVLPVPATAAFALARVWIPVSSRRPKLALNVPGQVSVVVTATPDPLTAAQPFDESLVITVSPAPVVFLTSSFITVGDEVGREVGTLSVSPLPSGVDSYAFSFTSTASSGDGRFRIGTGLDSSKLETGSALNMPGPVPIVVTATPDPLTAAQPFDESFVVTVSSTPVVLLTSSFITIGDELGREVGTLSVSPLPSGVDSYTFSFTSAASSGNGRFRIGAGSGSSRIETAASLAVVEVVEVRVTATPVPNLAGEPFDQPLSINIVHPPVVLLTTPTITTGMEVGREVGTLSVSYLPPGVTSYAFSFMSTASSGDGRFRIGTGVDSSKLETAMALSAPGQVTIVVTATPDSLTAAQPFDESLIITVSPAPVVLLASSFITVGDEVGREVGTLSVSPLPSGVTSYAFSFTSTASSGDGLFRIGTGVDSSRLETAMALSAPGQVTIVVTATPDPLTAAQPFDESLVITVSPAPVVLLTSSFITVGDEAGREVGTLSVSPLPSGVTSYAFSFTSTANSGDGLFRIGTGVDSSRLETAMALNAAGQVTIVVTATPDPLTAAQPSDESLVITVSPAPVVLLTSSFITVGDEAGREVGTLSVSPLPPGVTSYAFSFTSTASSGDGLFRIGTGVDSSRLETAMALNTPGQVTIVVTATPDPLTAAQPFDESLVITVSPAQTLTLTPASIAVGDAIGREVGVHSVSNAEGVSYTYSLTLNPGMNFRIGEGMDANKLLTAKALTQQGSVVIEVTATPPAGATIVEQFTIEITPNGPVPSDILSHRESGNRIRVFPNPADDVVYLDLGQSGDYRVVLSTLVGKTVRDEYRLGGGIGTLDVSDLDSGLYILRVEEGGGQVKVFKITIPGLRE